MLTHRPSGMGAFEFVILASLRAAQLMRGCRPQIETAHKNTVTAQLEVAQGKVNAQSAAATTGSHRAGAIAAEQIEPFATTSAGS